MLGILFKADAKPGKLQELTDFLTRDGKFCRDEERDTLRFEFYPDPKNDNALYVYEAYRDEKAFEEHKKNPPYQEWSSGLKDELCTTNDVINGNAVWSPERSRPDKDRVESLLKLADASWRDYSERRTIEWKVNFALWSALGSFAGFMFQQKTALPTKAALVVSTILICTIAVYTFLWKKEMQHRNGLDTKAAQSFWAEVDKELSVPSPEVRTEKVDKEQSAWLLGLRKTHLTQVAITLFFVVLAIIAVWAPRSEIKCA